MIEGDDHLKIPAVSKMAPYYGFAFRCAAMSLTCR
jgi:hypothetical protein